MYKLRYDTLKYALLGNGYYYLESPVITTKTHQRGWKVSNKAFQHLILHNI